MRQRNLAVVAAAAASAVSAMAIPASAQVLYNPVVALIGDGAVTAAGTGYTATDEIYLANFPNQAAPLASNNYSGTTTGLVTENSAASGELSNNQEVSNAAAIGQQYLGTDYVFNGGYAGADGTATVTSGNASREVGYMTATPTALLSPTIGATQPGTSIYTADDIRGVTGIVSSSSFWAAGTGSSAAVAGFQYVNTPVSLNSTAPLNTRTIQIRNGQLYGSADTGSTFVGISAIGTGLPTTGSQTTLPLFQTATSSAAASPYAFALFDDTANTSGTAPGVASTYAAVPYNVAYVADAGFSTGNQGIQKWVYNSANGTTNGGWTKVYTLYVNDGNATTVDTGNFGLAAQLNPTSDNVYLWSTTNDGKVLQQFIDPLDAIGAATATTDDASEVTLATAPTNDLFRGVALAVPEPASAGLMGLGALGLLLRRRAKAT